MKKKHMRNTGKCYQCGSPGWLGTSPLSKYSRAVWGKIISSGGNVISVHIESKRNATAMVGNLISTHQNRYLFRSVRGRWWEHWPLVHPSSSRTSPAAVSREVHYWRSEPPNWEAKEKMKYKYKELNKKIRNAKITVFLWILSLNFNRAVEVDFRHIMALLQVLSLELFLPFPPPKNHLWLETGLLRQEKLWI